MTMNAHIVAALDLEIERLQQARAVLVGTESASKPAKKSVGRPKKVAAVPAKPKHRFSEAGLKAIKEAQQKRWAAKKAAESKKATTTKDAAKK